MARPAPNAREKRWLSASAPSTVRPGGRSRPMCHRNSTSTSSLSFATALPCADSVAPGCVSLRAHARGCPCCASVQQTPQAGHWRRESREGADRRVLADAGAV
eukprot:2241900-Rhodomonas_salina.1